jgi:hypothetical protein
MYRSIKEDSNIIYFIFLRALLYFLRILEVCTNFWRFKRKQKIKTVQGCEPAQRCDLKDVAAWRDQRPMAGAGHGHAAVGHLTEPAGAPSMRACGHHDHGRRGGTGATVGMVA